VTSLDTNDKIAFFLNIYQVAFTHKFIKEKLTKTSPSSGRRKLFSNLLNVIQLGEKNEDFFYNIGGLKFTIEDLKHGILRGNKKDPDAWFPTFSDKDPRNQITQISDQRILLTFKNDKEWPKKLEPYTAEDLDEKLDKMCKDFLSANVVFNQQDSKIILPMVFKKYKDDFGGSSVDIISFVLKYYKFYQKPEEVKIMVKNGTLKFSYSNQ